MIDGTYEREFPFGVSCVNTALSCEGGKVGFARASHLTSGPYAVVVFEPDEPPRVLHEGRRELDMRLDDASGALVVRLPTALRPFSDHRLMFIATDFMTAKEAAAALWIEMESSLPTLPT